MRLNTYLTEAKKKKKTKDLMPIQLIKKIQKECSQIIRLYQKEKRVFYRGVKSYQQWWNPKKPRLRSRTPKDTPIGTHNWLNNHFKSEFGWSGRNGVLVSPRRYTAEYYADSNSDLVHVFLPVNRYKFIYNPGITDLYDTLPQDMKRGNELSTAADAHDVWERLTGTTGFQEFDKKFPKYTNKNLGKALNAGVEVMFNATYYLIPLQNGEFNNYPLDAEDFLGFEPIQ